MTELESCTHNVMRVFDNLKREIEILSKLAINLDKEWQANSERLFKENKLLKEENQRLRIKR